MTNKLAYLLYQYGPKKTLSFPNPRDEKLRLGRDGWWDSWIARLRETVNDRMTGLGPLLVADAGAD